MRYFDGQGLDRPLAHARGRRRSGEAVEQVLCHSFICRRTVAEAHRGADDSDAIWSAVGKPVTGFGAGRYWMTPKFLFFERGTLRTDSQQVPISAVLDVDVRQSMTQKARGVFTVMLQIQRGANVENVSMDDIPHGREAQRIINNAAHQSRLAIQQSANTQTVRHEGGFVPAGVLTDDEFVAKKAEILSRM